MDSSAVTEHDGLISVEHQLYNVVVALGASRKQLRRLCDNRSVLENRCLAAEQGYAQCARAYQHLFDQHQAITRDLAETAGRCRSLEREAESAQTAILALESIGQRCERCDAADASHAPDAPDAPDAVDTSRAHSQAQAAGLEKENAELREALTRAADVICYLTQQVDSLQSTQCATERPQAVEVKSTTGKGNGNVYEEPVPLRETSAKKTRQSRKRKSS